MDAEKVAEKVAERTWNDVIHQAGFVLNYQLFELDGHGVSVGKLITGIFLMVVGYMASNRAAKEVDRRVLGKLHMDQSLRYTFQKLIFYLFFCLVSLFTLRTLNVPITIFTVIGGALAVGIGFGSQNLVNNFISGVLVMVERPIRVGDFIEIDGVLGTVNSIGIRSTMVKTPQDAAVIIPNTSFIEKNLTNWSFSHTVSDMVRIGVAYGTDINLLKQSVFQAVEQVKEVQNAKEHTLTFVDFGDNALIFDIGYSISSSFSPYRGRIRSDIRYRLNELFEKNKISVPYPQRDIRIVDAPVNLLQSRADVRPQ